MKGLFAFIEDEAGLVTIEWVGLASGVMLLTLGVISTINASTNAASSAIGSGVSATVSATLASAG